MRIPSRQSGFSVLELLVAVAISLILLAGVVTLFASSRRSYENSDHLARIQENGRFALDRLERDLRSAGYGGCAKQAIYHTTLNSSTALPWDFSTPLAGFDSTGTSWSPTLATSISTPTATAPAAINSDVLVVRAPDPDSVTQYLSTSMTAKTDAPVITPPATAPFATNDVLMISDCIASSVFQVTAYSAGTISHTATGTAPGNSTADLGYAFPVGSAVVKIRTTAYYVRPASDPTRGNSLWRIVGTNAAEELVEGVDSLQVLYGIDTNADQNADNYVVASSVTDWNSVVAVRVGVLVRSVEQYGTNPDVDHTVLDATIAAASDSRERLVFTTTVALRNKAL